MTLYNQNRTVPTLLIMLYANIIFQTNPEDSGLRDERIHCPDVVEQSPDYVQSCLMHARAGRLLTGKHLTFVLSPQ